MNAGLKLLPIASLMFFSFALAADEQHSDVAKMTDQSSADCYNMNVLFDPDVASAKKQSHIRAMEADAAAGSNYSRYMLGSFYRLGEKHPAKVFVRNTDKAKTYLSNSAVGGNYAAMASMAELELQEGNYREAMLWAQVYAYFSKEETKQRKAKSNFAYEADLLKRIMDQAQRQKKPVLDSEFLLDFDNFFKTHGETIQASHRRSAAAAEDIKSGTPLKFSCKPVLSNSEMEDPILIEDKKLSVSSDAYKLMLAPGYAYYLLTINQDGAVAKAVVVDSLPDERYGNALMDTVKKLKFNKASHSGIRQAYVPLAFDDYSIKLKKRR